MVSESLLFLLGHLCLDVAITIVAAAPAVNGSAH